MEKRLELYVTILNLVGQTMRMNDLRNVVTFAWIVVGLLLSKTIHLGQWGLQRDSSAKAASKERQISRWLHNPKIKPTVIYRDFATAALLVWAEQKAVLALDSSMLWGKYVIIRVSLIYRGRALPLAWKVLEHGSASVSFVEYAPVMQEVSRLLPLHCQVVLLADRGFADVDLMRLAVHLGWQFNIRAKGNLLVHRAFKPSWKMSRLMPPKGEVRLIHTVQITQRRFGPVHLVLAHVRTQNGYEQWMLISDRPTTLDTLDEYALRFDIEMVFTQMTKVCVFTVGRRRDHVANLDLVVVNDDTVDQQFYQLSALGKTQLVQGWRQALAKIIDVGRQLGHIQLLLGLKFQLSQLLCQPVLRLS